ncbi:hypothetical protein DERP_003045 [Dermatophagoides pteronyssinus]|uniref:Uncharacterized protein n=1 Tax=Dermatophagoides pteronyssinus TaxID=6956 RepID=A0ABQ8JIA6_DERPT|nr:hypothetical protein DERP_003019 [Dermatophagoides pteronyssinus]KAH9422370.1 hypothetical protein DERP_003045 [Dermatophagoides pteronyssinus]
MHHQHVYPIIVVLQLDLKILPIFLAVKNVNSELATHNKSTKSSIKEPNIKRQETNFIVNILGFNE